MTLIEQQKAIIDRIYHPSKRWVNFSAHDINQSIPQRFAITVNTFPDHIAIKDGDATLSYRELNRYSNQLAHFIYRQHNHHAEVVALAFTHVLPSVITILAVLKAGKAFMILDLDQPTEVLQNLLLNSAATLVISDTVTLNKAQAIITSKHCLLNLSELPNDLPDFAPEITILPDALAALLYTSGSTGQPKGVMKSHCSILYEIASNINTGHIGDADTVGLTKKLASSIGICFYTLLTGARLSYFDPTQHSLEEFINWLIADQVTLATFPRVLFRSSAILFEAHKTKLHLRLINLTGEHTLLSDISLFQKYYPDQCVLRSAYGATESWAACHYFYDHTSPFPIQSGLAGFDVEMTQCLILDETGEPCLTGEAGEIVIERPFMSNGYWQNPEATRAQFGVSPHNPQLKRYFTGDLGIKHSAGCLEVLGRKNNEVKIFGYRVNIAEIETVMHQIEGVVNVAVVPFKNTQNDVKLIAYWIRNLNSTLSEIELRQILERKLPRLSVPSHFIELNEFPMTSSGKINRRALPPPNRMRPNLNQPYIAPRFSDENRLAQIWSEVLNIDNIGVKDQFLDLGGNSLQAMQLVSRVRREFQIEITIQSLLQKATIEEMMLIIMQYQAKLVDIQIINDLLDELALN